MGSKEEPKEIILIIMRRITATTIAIIKVSFPNT